jgi:amidase
MVRRMRQKDLSAREVLAEHLARIARINPQVNAIITLVADQARAAAAELDEGAAHGRFAGILHGLPVAHKDNLETKGIRTTFGTTLLEHNVPDRSELIVERMEQAGAVTIGKTNVPEYAAGSQTFNRLFGPTRNPWDLTKTCGGSSGGSAVAVACGMMPIGNGTDLGGSLRNPASFCSVVGFRPSAGRIPRVLSMDGWNPLNVHGPLARNVEDAALLMAAMAGPDSRAPLSIHESGNQFLNPLDRDPKGIRIAWSAAPGGLPVDRGVTQVLEQQRRSLEDAGCIVEDAEPDFSGADEAFRTLRALSFFRSLGHLTSAQRSEVKAAVLDEIDRGARLTAAAIARAQVLQSEVYARTARFMDSYDFLMLPSTQVPPFPVEQEFVKEIDGRRLDSYIDWMGSCYLVTMTALPAISVPAGFVPVDQSDSPVKLPIGLQIVGRAQDDFGVLQMARIFEQVRGVFETWPAICA